MEAQVIKRGEVCIETILSRTPAGLQVRVKAHPRVEEFMRVNSGGANVDVGTIGRYWTVPKGEVLRVYTVPAFPAMMSDEGGLITLEKPGSALAAGEGSPGAITNISFLKLVGISEGEGVKFTVKGVYSLDGLKRVRDLIASATKRFYVEYLRPVDLTVQISTQQIEF